MKFTLLSFETAIKSKHTKVQPRKVKTQKEIAQHNIRRVTVKTKQDGDRLEYRKKEHSLRYQRLKIMGYTWTVLLVVMATILKVFLETPGSSSQFIVAPILGTLSAVLSDIVIYLATELRCFAMQDTPAQKKHTTTAENAYYAIFVDFAIAFVTSFITALILSISLNDIKDTMLWTRIILACFIGNCIIQMIPMLLRKIAPTKIKPATWMTYIGCVLNAAVMTLSWVVIKMVA